MKQRYLISIYFAALFLFAAAETNAQSVTVIDNLNFGRLSSPSDFDVVWTLDPATGGLIKNGGNSIDFVPGDHYRGVLIISGEPYSMVNYNFKVTSQHSDPGLGLEVLPAGGRFAIDHSGEVQIDFGGKLTIHKGASSGTHTDAIITLTVNYERNLE